MKLREMRIARGRQQKELGIAIGAGESMMSNFETYKCLPVPAMMQLLLKELDCKIDDIYEPNEIYLSSSKSTKRQEGDELDSYRLTVNLPREAKEIFKKALKKCGYKDITYWVYRCYERLQKQFEIILKAEKEKDLIAASKQKDEAFQQKGE